MNNTTGKISTDFQGNMLSSKRPLKRKRDSNDLPKENPGTMWIYSNASMKRNRMVDSDRDSHGRLEKNSLGRILEPGSEREENSAKSDDDPNRTPHFTKENVNQNIKSTVRSTDHLIRKVMKQLMGDLMHYETEIEKLYDKIREISNDNEKIRNRYTLMCSGIAGDPITSYELGNSRDVEGFSSDDETCACDDGSDVNDGSELTERALTTQDKSTYASSGRRLDLKQELDLLETRVFDSLEKLTKSLFSSKEISFDDLRNMGMDPEEMPLVKNLRNDLNRSYEELKKVRKFTDIRVSNLKSLLTSERQVSANVQQQLQESKLYMRGISDFFQRARMTVEHYRAACQDQQDTIESLKKKLADMQTESQDTPTESIIHRKKDDYDAILERYHCGLTAYTVLSSISQKQKGDISILHYLYEEEKRKCLSLTNVVEQQRKSMNPTRLLGSMGSITHSEILTKLSDLYENRCDESAKEERMHLAMMRQVHEMYQKLLEAQEREHQSIIENLVRELNEWKKSKKRPQKTSSSYQGGVTFDGNNDEGN